MSFHVTLWVLAERQRRQPVFVSRVERSQQMAPVTPRTTGTTRIGRCLIFAREHLQQARAAGDQIRAMQWETVMDQFIDALPRPKS
jgi:hypothetical protein